MSHNHPPRPWWGKKSVARAAMENWSFSSSAKLSYVQFGENATWKVQDQGKTWALRVYRPNRWTAAQMKVEHRLMDSLGERFGVGVPVLAGCGNSLVSVPHMDLQCALFPWAKGRLLYRKVTPKMVRRLGKYMGEMHSHLMHAGNVDTLKRWDDRNLLLDQVEIAQRVLGHIGFSPKSFSFLQKKVDSLLQRWNAFAPLDALVHADLHLGNLKWTADRLYPIDFDDCGYAPLPYDLAIPAYCFGRLKGDSTLLDLFLESYNAVGPKEVVLDELRLFMAIRRVWILGWVCDRQDIFSKKSLKERCTSCLRELNDFF